MDKNQVRRENYRFYRSMGYSVKQATNMRNRAPDRVANEYRYRQVDYKQGPSVEPDKKAYRPQHEVDESDVVDYAGNLRDHGMPDDLIDQMYDNPDVDFLDWELMSERIDKLQDHFEQAGVSWQDLMAELDSMSDAGEWWDMLGEKYDETT